MQKNTSNSTTTDEKGTKAKPPPRVLPRRGGGVFYLRFRNNIQSICICNIIPREINIIFDEIIEKVIYCQCVFVQLFKILLSNHCKVEVVRSNRMRVLFYGNRKRCFTVSIIGSIDDTIFISDNHFSALQSNA